MRPNAGSDHRAGGVATATLNGASVKSVLIIRMSALGDVVHALPALSALRARFPDAEISWLVEPLGASILEGHPQLDRLVVIDRKHWLRDLRSPRRWPRALAQAAAGIAGLRRRRFDLAVDFQGNLRSGLAALASGARVRLGFAPEDCREWGGWIFSNLRAPPAPLQANKAVKNLHLLRAVGWEGPPPAPAVPITAADRSWARQILDAVPGSAPVVLIHPSVSRFGAFKRWPPSHYRALCERLEESFGARILVSWGPGERQDAEAIGRGQLIPPTPRLLRLAALIAECDLFIAADTGNLHLAAALGTPTIGLYGPKSPEVYGPFVLKGRLLRSGVPCSPCELRRCEHRICMSSLLPERVFEAARALLAAEVS
jgi:lipopolysaccharide heptosyltransferase I